MGQTVSDWFPLMAGLRLHTGTFIGQATHVFSCSCSSFATRPMAEKGGSSVSFTATRMSVAGQPMHCSDGGREVLACGDGAGADSGAAAGPTLHCAA
jgi:hypothetical protein